MVSAYLKYLAVEAMLERHPRVPMNTLADLHAYISSNKRPDDGMLQAVLENDLIKTIALIAGRPLDAIPAIILCVLEECPPERRGSVAAVESWIAKGSSQ